MISVHFLINKLNIEHIIALGGKKSNEKLGKKGNQCKNAANSVTGHVCMNSNKLRPMTKKRSAVCILIILFKKKTYGSHPSRHPAVLTAADVWSLG